MESHLTSSGWPDKVHLHEECVDGVRCASLGRNRPNGKGGAGVGNGGGFARHMGVGAANKQAHVTLMVRGKSKINLVYVLKHCSPRCACKHRKGCCAHIPDGDAHREALQ